MLSHLAPHFDLRDPRWDVVTDWLIERYPDQVASNPTLRASAVGRLAARVRVDPHSAVGQLTGLALAANQRLDAADEAAVLAAIAHYGYGRGHLRNFQRVVTRAHAWIAWASTTAPKRLAMAKSYERLARDERHLINAVMPCNGGCGDLRCPSGRCVARGDSHSPYGQSRPVRARGHFDLFFSADAEREFLRAGRLAEQLGDDLRMWRTFAVLVPTWSGPVDDLVATVRALASTEITRS